jgi:hypothetical protein
VTIASLSLGSARNHRFGAQIFSGEHGEVRDPSRPGVWRRYLKYVDDGGRVNLRIAVYLRIAGVAALAAIGAVAASSCDAAEVMVRSRSAQQIDPVEANDCSVQYQTLAVAVEAFWASTGGPPASETELVSADMLREEVDDFDVIIADADYEVIGVYECARFDPES